MPAKAGADYSVGFVNFWKTWPINDRKQAKGKCFEAWKKAGAEPQAALIVAHVERMKRSPGWTKDGGEYVPAPLVYLNQRRWEGTDAAAPPAGAWWTSAGFANLYEANNEGCYEHNAAQFHNGKRDEVPA